MIECLFVCPFVLAFVAKTKIPINYTQYLVKSETNNMLIGPNSKSS